MVGNRHRAVSMAFNGSVSDNDKQKSIKSLSDLRSMYKDIRYDWPQLVSGDISPIELAISFLDDTSVGLAHRKNEFDELCASTGDALRAAVVENHEVFNNSIGSYHLLLSMAKESQDDSLAISDLIESSTKDMRTRSTSLKDLDSSSSKYAEMIDILDAMDHLRNVPERVDKLIAEKKIHEVYDVIADGYATATKYNLWSLSSMGATQHYLESQSNNLYDMIVEELQNEIYLKSTHHGEAVGDVFGTASSQFNGPGQTSNQSASLESYIYNSANLDIQEIAEALTSNTEEFIFSQLPKLHQHYSRSNAPKIEYSILLESKSNSLSESFYYIYMLLSTASKLNKLHSVTEILITSLQSEIYLLINQATEECKQRNFHRLARLAKARALESHTLQDKVSGQSLNDLSVPILQDFFESFLTKCLMVLQKHKVTCEIIKSLTASDDISSKFNRLSTMDRVSNVYDFQTVWSILRKEIETLIFSYIQEDPESEDTLAKKTELSGNKIHHILNKKQLFQFDDVSSSKSGSTSEEMRSVLSEMFPGLAMGEDEAVTPATSDSPYITNEGFSSVADVLVPRNVYNMRVILDYLLVFVAGAHSLFNDFGKTKTSAELPYQFFHEFIQNSFLRFLGEQMTRSLNDCMASDLGVALSNDNPKSIGFNQETVAVTDSSNGNQAATSIMQSSATHIYSNAVEFKQLFGNVCYTMNTSFTYRRDISNLVLDLLRRFTMSYESYFEELLDTGGSHDITEMGLGLQKQNKRLSKIAKWMRVPSLVNVSGSLISRMDATEERDELIQKENDLMLFQSNSENQSFDVTKDDIFDDKWFDHVCTLLLTTTWILSWLPLMRKESNYAQNSDQNENDINKLKHEYTFLENGRASKSLTEKNQRFYLTLNSQAIQEFDKLVSIFEGIRDQLLIALRYSARLQALYYIGQSFSESFVLSTEPADSDVSISHFNKELYFVGTKANTLLNKSDGEYIFMGLPSFINQVFLQTSELVKVINKNGVKRIILNIVTCQQMLRSVMAKEASVDLSHASRYFQMFTLTEQKLIPKLEESKGKYSKKELLNLVRLIYSERLNQASVSSFNKTKYSEVVKKINEIYT